MKLSTNKMTIFFLLLLSLSGLIRAAENLTETISELEGKLPSLSGREKVEALNKLAYCYKYSASKKMMAYASQALDLARKENYQKGEGGALSYIGLAHMQSGNYEKSIENAEKSLNIFKQLEDKKNVFETLNVIGIIYVNFGFYNKALASLQEALELSGDKDIPGKLVASVLGNIGVVYKYLGNAEKDLEYQLKALDIREKIGDEKGMSVSFDNIAHTYDNQHNYEKALEYFRKSVEISERLGNKLGMAISMENMGGVFSRMNQNEKAIKYSQKSLRIFREAGDKYMISASLNSIGTYYSSLNKYKKSLECQLEALKFGEELGNRRHLYIILNSVGAAYAKLKDYGNALTYYKRSLKLHQESGEKLGADILINLTNLYSDLGDFKKALEYHHQYYLRKAKHYDESQNKQLAEMQAKYETLQKEKEIEALKQDKHIRDLELNRQTFMRNISIIIASLVLIIFLQFFRRYHYLFTFWKKRTYIGYYKLMDKIGSGGMGEIYKARNIKDKARTSTYAIKVLREEYNNDEKYKKRFKNEAAVIDQLQHPNIVKVMERGEHNGTLYIAMELLEGQTLADKLEKETPLPLKTALSIMIQMASAIVEIHKRGIIHRDLKPENIMVIESMDNEMQIKILDFGLARTQNLTRLTRSGMIMGTIFYVSPEQLTHSKVLCAGDIYSLGVIYYQLLTGKKPFRGDTVFDIARQIIKHEPPAIDTLYPGIPSGLTELIKQMMSKDPAQRPLANEMKERLEEYSSNPSSSGLY